MEPQKRKLILRIFVIYLFTVVFALAVLTRLIKVQFVEGDALKRKLSEQTLKYFDLEALRGNICASDGTPLAISVPIFEVRMDVASDLITDETFSRNIDKLSEKLSGLFRVKTANQWRNELMAERNSGNRYFLIKSNATYPELQEMRKMPIFNLGAYKGGLIVIPRSRREKPFKMLAERTVGFENKKEKIYVGIEGAYSGYLSGKDGKQLRKRINNAEWMPLFDENDVEPENGKDVISTIDINIQDVAEASLYRHLAEHKAEWGCTILMETKTGQIKAIVNLKKDSIGETYSERYNFAIGTAIEPGSTFKLASMLSLLEDNLVGLENTVNIGNGTIFYHGCQIRDVHAKSSVLTVREVFEESSNVGVSKLVNTLYGPNPKKYTDRLYSMSLNVPLGIDLPGEGKPFIKNPDSSSWSGVSLPYMSIGYELQITPLQILTLYNSVANNGEMVRPQFVREIRQGGQVIKTFDKHVINPAICSPSTIAKARELLEGVVERGTAKRLKDSPYKVAGKTGTAKISGGLAGYNNQYNASFVGYFPADAPEYSCIVVVNRPSAGKIYGGEVAVPVFKEIADKIYSTQLDIQKTEEKKQEEVVYPDSVYGLQPSMAYLYGALSIPYDHAGATTGCVVAVKNEYGIRMDALNMAPGVIPDLKGFGARDAMFILEKMGMQVVLNGKGRVKEQSVLPGSAVNTGEYIVLTLEI